jgi:hypothetical protein
MPTTELLKDMTANHIIEMAANHSILKIKGN